MRTLAIIVGGLVLLGFTLTGARYVGAGAKGVMVIAVQGFLLVWFFIAFFNFWIGVTGAGYSFGEELPIFLLIYGVPAALAAFVWWRLAGRA